MHVRKTIMLNLLANVKRVEVTLLIWLMFVSLTLNKSTLSLEFVDTERPCSNNFLFTANAITSVVCKKDRENCVVTVEGTGLVNGRQYSFKAVFKDQIAPAANDIVQSFVIKGFFDQNGAVCVPQGSIVALGCQEL